MFLIKDLLLWIYWNPFKLFVQKLNATYIYIIARALGIILYYVSYEKRRRLEEKAGLILRRGETQNTNATCAGYTPIKGYTTNEKRKAVMESFKVWMCNELEVIKFPFLNKENISSFVSCSGLENLDNAMCDGRGAILLFAHFGANQMVMPAIGYRGYKMSQLSAPATVWKEKMPDRKFSYMEERAMRIRWFHELSLPVRHINIFGSLKEAFRCLGRNEVLGVAIDGGGGKEKVAVNFLGMKAFFSRGAVDIALRTGSPILPVFVVRGEGGRNTMFIKPPLKINQGGNSKETVTVIAQRFAELFEEYVIRYPSHYIGFLDLRSLMAEKGEEPFLTHVKSL